MQVDDLLESTQPLEIVEYTLDPAERTCLVCGQMLREWTAADGATLLEHALIDRSHVLKKHVRKLYRCECGAAPVEARGPVAVPGGGPFAIDFASEVACAKYARDVPLERQARTFSQYSVELNGATLWEQIEKLARVLALSYNALREHLVDIDIVHVDEARWTAQSKGSKTWWVWSIARPDAVYYRVAPARGHAVIADVLAGFDGTLMVDDYIVDLTVKEVLPQLTSVLSWTHVRKAFEAALTMQPQAQRGLELIAELFEVEGDPPDWRKFQDAERRKVALDYIREVRAERAAPLCERLLEWARSQEAAPASKLHQALEDLTSQWSSLTHFLTEPRVPLSADAPVFERRPHHGSKSLRGVEVAALFYSLIETAKLAGVDPAKYLCSAAELAIEQGQALLPQQLRASRRPPSRSF